MRHFISPLLLSTVFAASAHAESPHIIINALRSPTPITQMASSVTVIDEQEIQRKNKPTMVELLRDVPGIALGNNGGVGQTTSLFMRGTNSNHVLVMMDGVRLNDPTNPADSFDFSNLTTDNIERIEILRGAQSTLYGSQAIGGVINITTKKGRGAPTYNAMAESGRYGSHRTSAGTSGEMGRTSYSLQGGYQRTNGISSYDRKFGGTEKDESQIWTLSTNVENRVTDQFTAKFNARYNRTETEFDSLSSFVRPYDDALPENDNRQINLRAAGELSLYDGFWKQELGISTMHLDRNAITEFYDDLFNAYFGRQEYTGKRNAVDWIHHLNWSPTAITTVGFEIYRDYAKATFVKPLDAGNKAAFIDNQYRLNKNIFIGGSARIDDHQTFGHEFTWKISPGYDITSTDTTLKASYGTGFKAPSLTQLYDPIYGNTALTPEKSKTYEFGIQQRFLNKRLNISASIFRSDIEGLITNAAAFPFANINVGQARAEGVESGIKFQALPELSLYANHTFTIAENRTSNARLLRRPKHQFNAGAVYDYNENIGIDGNLRYLSNRKDSDFAPPFGLVYVKPATVLDLGASYKVHPNAKLYARLENLLDERYEEVYGYGQPGRGLYVGVKANY